MKTSELDMSANMAKDYVTEVKKMRIPHQECRKYSASSQKSGLGPERKQSCNGIIAMDDDGECFEEMEERRTSCLDDDRSGDDEYCDTDLEDLAPSKAGE